MLIKKKKFKIKNKKEQFILLKIDLMWKTLKPSQNAERGGKNERKVDLSGGQRIEARSVSKYSTGRN